MAPGAWHRRHQVPIYRHERDAECRLDYMLERSYASDTGRFPRPDPMQDEYPGISPYAYAANNPLKYVDPDGSVEGAVAGTAAVDATRIGVNRSLASHADR